MLGRSGIPYIKRSEVNCQIEKLSANRNETKREGYETRSFCVPHHVRPSHPHLPICILSHSCRVDVDSGLGIGESSLDVGDETADGSWVRTSVVELEDVSDGGGFGEAEATGMKRENMREKDLISVREG